MKILTFVLLGCALTANAETRIYKTDSVGNTQYHKGSYVVKDNTIVQKDSVGNTQSHKGQHVIVGDRIYQRDSVGNTQYHKGSAKIGK